MTFRFVHAADLHLDSPMTGVAMPPEPIFRALRDASLATFDALIDATIRQRAGLLLIAGGLYDGPEMGLRAQVRFHSGLERLSGEGIETVIRLAPTDPPPEAWSAVPGWPERVHFVAAGEKPVTIEQDGEAVATVYGWHDAAPPAIQPDSPGVLIGIAHSHPSDPGWASSTDFHYVALGGTRRWHVHSQAPWIVDAGTLQGRSFHPDDRGPHGAMLVTAEGSTVHEVHFTALEVARFEEIALDVTTAATTAGVATSLLAQAAAVTPSHDGAILVASAVLSGGGPVHESLNLPGAAAELLQALRAGSAQAHPHVWWATLEDRTRRDRDLDAIHARGDFSAELLTTARALRDRPDLMQQAVTEDPAALGLEAGDAGPLMMEAATRALDLLERPDSDEE